MRANFWIGLGIGFLFGFLIDYLPYIPSIGPTLSLYDRWIYLVIGLLCLIQGFSSEGK